MMSFKQPLETSSRKNIFLIFLTGIKMVLRRSDEYFGPKKERTLK
jgi:hypothetical protein